MSYPSACIHHSYSLHGFMIDCERCLYDCYLPALIETKQESNASLSFFHPHPHLYIYLSIYLRIHPSNTTNQRWCAYSCFCRLCKALWPSGRKMFVVTFAWVGLYDSHIHNFSSHHLSTSRGHNIDSDNTCMWHCTHITLVLRCWLSSQRCSPLIWSLTIS